MHLTLFVPDLLWPDREHIQAFEFESAPQLARFLFLADYTAEALAPADSWESALARLFGFKNERPPLGALRLLGESPGGKDTPADGCTLLCADPVNLDFIQQAMVLSNIAASDLDEAEAALLISALNEEFAGEGKFFAGATNAHWYFQPTDPAIELPNLPACSRLLGRRVDADESRQLLGREGLRWLNRIQICLNNHPVNEARQIQGKSIINSVWPWGAGLLDPAQHHPGRFQSASGESTLLRGLCEVTGTAHVPGTAAPAPELILDKSLASAIAHNDLDAWKNAIEDLSCQWITPALSALEKGELTTLTLIAPDAHKTQHWVLHKTHKGLRPSLINRLLGNAPKSPDLVKLIRPW